MRTRTRSALLLTFSLALPLIAIELAVRFAHPFGVEFDYATLRDELSQRDDSSDPNAIVSPAKQKGFLTRFGIHPYVGFALREQSEDKSKYGFWGGEKLFSPSDDRVVVVLTGGSVAKWVYIDRGDELRAALERLPIFEGKRVELVSTALGGYKQPQQLFSLIYFLALGGHFDVWVNLDGFNEVTLTGQENWKSGTAIAFPRSWPEFAGTALDPDLLELGIEVGVERAYRETLRARVLRFQGPQSALGLMVWKLRDRRYENRIFELQQQAEQQAQRRVSPDYLLGPKPEHANRDELLLDAVRLWSESSLQMHYVCAANGIRYVHLLQPNQYVPDSKSLSDEELRTAYVQGEYSTKTFVQEGYPLLVNAGKLLAEQGVQFSDLTHLFAQEPETVYRDKCCHMNEYGSDILARAIADAVGEAYMANAD